MGWVGREGEMADGVREMGWAGSDMAAFMAAALADPDLAPLAAYPWFTAPLPQ